MVIIIISYDGTHCLYRQGCFIWIMMISFVIWWSSTASIGQVSQGDHDTDVHWRRCHGIVTRIIMDSFNRNLPPSFWDSSWVSPSLPREEAYQDPYSGSLLHHTLSNSGPLRPLLVNLCHPGSLWVILGLLDNFGWWGWCRWPLAAVYGSSDGSWRRILSSHVFS